MLSSNRGALLLDTNMKSTLRWEPCPHLGAAMTQWLMTQGSPLQLWASPPTSARGEEGQGPFLFAAPVLGMSSGTEKCQKNQWILIEMK